MLRLRPSAAAAPRPPRPALRNYSALTIDNAPVWADAKHANDRQAKPVIKPKHEHGQHRKAEQGGGARAEEGKANTEIKDSLKRLQKYAYAS